MFFSFFQTCLKEMSQKIIDIVACVNEFTFVLSFGMRYIFYLYVTILWNYNTYNTTLANTLENDLHIEGL